MKRSTDRILVSHAGTLPRPQDLSETMAAGPAGADEFAKRLIALVRGFCCIDFAHGVVADFLYEPRGGVEE